MFRMPAIIKLFLCLAAALAFALTSVPQAFADDTAPTYIARVSGGSFNPSSICAGMSATAQVTGSLNVQNPNQEYEESGDSWTYSPSVTGYKATQDASYGAVPSNAVSVSGNVTASADKSTTPGYYQITVSATDNFNVTHDGTTTPQSASGSTTLEICVVGLGAIQYKDPDDGWVALPSPAVAMKETTVSLRAVPVPADASYPPGQPVWSGLASGTGETATATFSTVSTTAGDQNIIVTLGVETPQINKAIASTYKLNPYFVPYVEFSGRSHTEFGVGETVDIYAGAKPADVQPGAMKWTTSGGPAQLFNATTVGTDATMYAGTTSGSTTFTVTITSGLSKGKTDTLTSTTDVPSSFTIYDSNLPHYHIQGDASAGFKGVLFLTPTNVSFGAIKMREHDVTAQSADGVFTNLLTHYHMSNSTDPEPDAANPPQSVSATDGGQGHGCFLGSSSGSSVSANLDTARCDAHYTGTGAPSSWAGNFDYEIPWFYEVHTLTGDYTSEVQLKTIAQKGNSDASGTTVITKGSGGDQESLDAPSKTAGY